MPNIIMADKPSGGFTVDDIAKGAPTGDVEITTDSVTSYAFYYKSGITSVIGLSVASIGGSAFQSCSSCTSFCFPSATVSSYAFNDCSAARAIVVGNASGITSWARSIQGTGLVVDIGRGGIANQAFSGSSKLDVLVLRSGTVQGLANVNAFSSTAFASGGRGGTIYIPKSLYDHLGDGTNLDYKAASNWSTVDGYGTITWAQIEGSIYETQYADGTPIPSA